MDPKLDDLDKQILKILLRNAKTSYADIGKELFVSSGTIHVRVKKLEKMGVILGSKLSVDYALIGLDVCAFLGIYLAKSSLFDHVADQLKEIPELVSVHYTTGAYSIFAKVLCKDTTHLREVLHDKIQKIDGIQRTETFISLEQSFERTGFIM